MTQDIDRIGSIFLGTGYKSDNEKQKRLIPRDRLLRFLNLPTSEARIKRFCNDYKVIPNNLENGLVEGFKELQAKIRELVDKGISGNLTDDDINYLNSRIGNIRPKLALAGLKELIRINENLNGEDTSIMQVDRTNKQRGLVELRKYPSIESVLYWDLVNLLMDKRTIKNCQYCGAYFKTTLKSQKYCCKYHKDTAHEKRRKRIR